ncbi:ABC transporter substrate-binding protein [Falsiroseomonas sp. CW058]|uniref:ABC transporter substrate-binding protein n=1 Tax=Falsiroseomonas sp. CW058 TaxID=3388664 RepID=UPI003D3162EB
MTIEIDRRRLLAGAAAAAGLAGAGGQALAQAAPRSSIAVRVERDPEIIDPGFRTGPHDGNIIRVVYQRLLRHKPNSGELELDAAAEVTQASPTVIDFRLKPGQMFTDGFGEMTAEDVKFSFERIGLEPAAGARPSPYRGDWAGLERVEVTGQHTGRIVLSRPNASLMNIAIGDVSGCIVSRRAVEQRGVEHNTRPVGSGPYALASLERQRGAVLRANPAHAGARPAFNEVAVRFIPDNRATELALRAGELDFAVLPPSVAEPLRGVQGLTISEQPGLQYIWLGMNMEKAPLSDIRVRQAIRLGLDVDQMLIAGYNGRAPRLNTLLPPAVDGHWAEAPVYRRNVAEARRLLAEAGVRNPRVKLLVLNQPAFQNMALVARALLAEIGVTVEVDARDGGGFWSAGRGDAGREIDMHMMVFNGKLDPNFLMQWFVSGQVGTWNWQRFASPEFDRLFEQAAAELDPARRRAMVIEAQQLMDRSAAFVWLTNNVSFLAHRSWLRPASVPGWLDWQYDSFAVA